MSSRSLACVVAVFVLIITTSNALRVADVSHLSYQKQKSTMMMNFPQIDCQFRTQMHEYDDTEGGKLTNNEYLAIDIVNHKSKMKAVGALAPGGFLEEIFIGNARSQEGYFLEIGWANATMQSSDSSSSVHRRSSPNQYTESVIERRNIKQRNVEKEEEKEKNKKSSSIYRCQNSTLNMQWSCFWSFPANISEGYQGIDPVRPEWRIDHHHNHTSSFPTTNYSIPYPHWKYWVAGEQFEIYLKTEGVPEDSPIPVYMGKIFTTHPGYHLWHLHYFDYFAGPQPLSAFAPPANLTCSRA